MGLRIFLITEISAQAIENHLILSMDGKDTMREVASPCLNAGSGGRISMY